MTFEAFVPTVSENISAGIVAELFAKADWRAYVEGQHPEAMVLIERYLAEDATAPDIFNRPGRAREPIASFSWRSPNGVWHQGALYLNGAVYRQALGDYRCHTLLIDDATATTRRYPTGWIRLAELEVHQPHGQHDQGSSVSR